MPGGVKFWNPVSVRADVVANADLDSVDMAANTAVLAAETQSLQGSIVLATGSNVEQIVVPFGGTISAIYTVIDGVLTTGDETLSFKVNAGTSMGDVVITQSGSAIGDVDTLAPSANNTVAAGDVVNVTTDGANGTATNAQIVVVVTGTAP